jgi:decaprenylphospho-beta-D-erythro-pentofuranosid-2-ulose 2-reductase
VTKALKQAPHKILILGATSSIPSSHLFLVGRNKIKLVATAQDLATRGAGQVDICVLDLDDTKAHAQMLASAAERLGSIDMALLAHGVLGDQDEAQASYAVSEAVLATNFLSPVSLITWLANYFEAKGSGVLAVISSVAGDRGRKSNYVYGSSKAALNVFLDGVRNRVDRHGVHVLTIKPGFVATPMTAHIPKNKLFATPPQVAKGILKAIDKRKDIVYVPFFWWPIMTIIKLIPEGIYKGLSIGE